MYGYEWRNTNVSGNAFDRWFYVSFLSVSCFCKNQKNETRKYRGGKEKIKCISDLYNACSDYCDCAYLDRIEGIDVESVSSGIYDEVCYG